MNRLRAVFDLQFAKGSPQVNLDRVFADAECVGHRAIAHPFVDHLQQFDLAPRELVWRRTLARILALAFWADQSP